RVRASGTHVPSVAFAQARRLVTWHYQWIVVHEFLPQICGHARVRAALRHRRLFRPRRGQAQIPVEFQAAAYRMGHSMVRPSYRVNLAGDAGQPFFDFGDGQVKPNKLIDTRLSTPLFHLPLGAIASHDHPTALAQRTLLRHLTWSLPSGQAIAREIGEDPLTRQDLRELAPLGHRLDRSTPLWYYVLREAELVEDGLRLGPVGGSIVAEVLIGLMQTDPASWLCTHP